MNVANSAAQVAARTRRGAQAIAASPPSSVRAAADAAAGIMRSTAAASRTKGITVRTRQFTSEGTGAAASVRYGPNAGWVQIQNGPTAAHFIGPRGGGSLRGQNLASPRLGGRRSARGGRLVVSGLLAAFGGEAITSRGRKAKGRRALRTPYGPKAYVYVRGVRKKGWVERGIHAAEPVATRVFVTEERNAMLKGFRG